MSKLEEIKARAEKTTPGPWRNYTPNPRHNTLQTVEDSDGNLVAEGCRQRDAEFIAHAPEIQAKLIAALEAVEALHIAEGNGNCIVCWDFNNDIDVKYPCPTITAITEALQ